MALTGANARRYHGLLVSALKPPTSRHLLLSNVLEDIIFEDGKSISLSSFITKGSGPEEYISPGFKHLQRFKYDYLPEYVYSYKDIIIKKKIAMKQGENTTVILYEIRNGSGEVILKLTPLVNFRDHHYQSTRDSLRFTAGYEGNEIIVSPEGSREAVLRLGTGEGQLQRLDNCYFYNMYYPVEQERGLDCIEDHYIPGYYTVRLEPWECKTISFAATTENYSACEIDAAKIIADEEMRLESLLKINNSEHDLLRRLVLAADDFIVYRNSTRAKTVIAGYPWFTDWGRDTMIAFPGLTLATGRYDDAKEILFTFSKYVDFGLIPNMFPDDGEKPAYNSVDAALWYFEAVKSYLDYTRDFEFIKANVYGSLKSICAGFINGTLYNIEMTEDGLITAGNESTQLTWMDAKVGDWVVTPRHGKAVEINALWYNGLMIMSELAQGFSDTDIYLDLASKAKAAFEKVFWNEELQCLYDVVNEAGSDSSIRPNQILAVGLANAVLEGHKAKCVVEKVWRELYTPYGLRTLSEDSPQYRGIYTGDVWSRDGAYHQGTVWTWLLGRFIKAFVRVNGNTDIARKNAVDFIMPFADHMKDGGIGSISEIFDGDSPHYPKGCFAQAWSVAEILRAAVEDAGLK
ncbi:MAG: putative glycogen debranching enzyme [Eubacterium sp.]|nr:putative glycogen debranching enzyme [Eubacterium sp.]